MKPSKEALRAMADELDIYAEDAALMAFAMHWYAAGQDARREQDERICIEFSDTGFLFADKIRTTPNED